MAGQKKPRPAKGDSFGILNPWGDFWTHQTFLTRGDAAAYVVEYWSNFPGRPDLSEPKNINAYKIVPVRVTVSLLPERLAAAPAPKPIDTQPGETL